MKKLSYLLGLSIVLFGCLEEQWDAADGGKSVANLNPPEKVSFLFGETTTIDIDLAPFVAGKNVIQTYTITKTLTAGGISSTPVVYNQGTSTFSQTVAELFADVPINDTVLTDTDLAPGDKWDLEYSFTMDNGDVFTVGYGTEIPFSCPSNIPTDGSWTSSNTEGAFSNFTTNASVTIAALDADGNYSITDITSSFYVPFGPTWNANQPGEFNDLCNVITITSSDAQVDLQQDSDEPGSWDPGTETLTMPWYDATNDFEDVSVLTRN